MLLSNVDIHFFNFEANSMHMKNLFNKTLKWINFDASNDLYWIYLLNIFVTATPTHESWAMTMGHDQQLKSE